MCTANSARTCSKVTIGFSSLLLLGLTCWLKSDRLPACPPVVLLCCLPFHLAPARVHVASFGRLDVGGGRCGLARAAVRGCYTIARRTWTSTLTGMIIAVAVLNANLGAEIMAKPLLILIPLYIPILLPSP